MDITAAFLTHRSQSAHHACPACTAPCQDTPRRTCTACGTVWTPDRLAFEYDDTYPEQRSHADAAVARCKQVTLAHWIRRTRIPLQGRQVLEIGFGAGSTLHWLQQQGAEVAGQEPVEANRRSAAQGGIDPRDLAPALEDFAGRTFDLALYLDAFEHLPDPAAHLETLRALTAPGSQALLVLPVADSLTRRLMGRTWPHDIADHWVFYSTQGLAELWGRHGWRLVQRFYPWKYLSALTIARHIEHKTGLRLPATALAHTGAWLNFGERGLVFERV